MNTDRAVLLALLVGELVTNAAKHAYRSDTPGDIWVTVGRSDDERVVVSVRDEGKALPEDSGTGTRGLGMTIVDAFVAQSGASLEIRRLAQGKEFRISVKSESL
jgi:two-component sensor histidine kinase